MRGAAHLVSLVILAAPSIAWGQTGPAGVPNALQGFSQNRDKPVQIEAAQLEVRDKDKMAVFSGNVMVTQGDTTMKSKSLHVFYDQEDAKGGMKTAAPGPGGKQTIRRLEARGGVVVTQKEQTATGAIGIFDMKSNTVTLEGGVTITQAGNILRGERLVVDLGTSYARVEAGKGGTVQGMFSTKGKEEKDEKPASAARQKDANKPSKKATKPASSSSSAQTGSNPFPAPGAN